MQTNPLLFFPFFFSFFFCLGAANSFVAVCDSTHHVLLDVHHQINRSAAGWGRFEDECVGLSKCA
jgi:hypothetical protein